MVDRITGYMSGVIAPTPVRRSRHVAGEALNQRVPPRRDQRKSGDQPDDDQTRHHDDSVDVRLSADSRAVRAYGAKSAALRGSDDVLISDSTMVLLGEDLSSLIRRAVTNVGLVVHTLMRVPGRATQDVERRFHLAALSAVRRARETYMQNGGGAHRMPLGLAFKDISARYHEIKGTAEIALGEAEFVDRIDLRAKGVVFDVRGEAVVHKPKPGIFVDTGEHGAVIANTIIETVRRDLPLFGGSQDTEGAIVLIRADNSDFSDHRSPAEWLAFDLILPFRSR